MNSNGVSAKKGEELRKTFRFHEAETVSVEDTDSDSMRSSASAPNLVDLDSECQRNSSPASPKSVSGGLKKAVSFSSKPKVHIIPTTQAATFSSISPRNFANRTVTQIGSLIAKQKVVLESVFVNVDGIEGIIVVDNIDFAKLVTVRFSVNAWETSQAIDAIYQYAHYSEHWDYFRFRIPLNSLPRCYIRLDFAVCYKVNRQEYWDNNNGQNFVLDYVRPLDVAFDLETFGWTCE